MIAPDKPRELALIIPWQGGHCVAQLRTHQKDVGLGFWGGKIREKEEPFDAAVREFGEEFPLDKFDVSLLRWLTDPEKPIDYEGWRIHGFQYPLGYDFKQNGQIEGEAVRILPIDMYKDPRVMTASRILIEEFILKPNGIIDN